MTYAILSGNAIVAYGPASALWPDCSFPIDGPNTEFLAEQGAVSVRSDLPHDPETERLVPAPPYLLDGEVFDRIAEPLPPPPAVPRWVEFGAALVQHPGANAMVAAARDAAPILHGMLVVGLGQAAQGDPRTFQAAWAGATAAGLVAPGLVESLQALAATFDLPAEFVAGLASAP